MQLRQILFCRIILILEKTDRGLLMFKKKNREKKIKNTTLKLKKKALIFNMAFISKNIKLSKKDVFIEKIKIARSSQAIFYQKFLSPLKRNPCCRFTPTCSVYFIQAVTKYGAFKGGILALWRILRCNPFSKGGYDPVPWKLRSNTRRIHEFNLFNKGQWAYYR